MIQAIELENFKAFGARTRIEFAPITLIFGENSAGKSSILQSLGLLKQTRESREHGALLLPRTDNGFVDLGSFQELLFDHDLKRELVIRVDLEGQTGQQIWDRIVAREDGQRISGLGVEFGIFRPSEQDEVTLRSIKIVSPELKTPVAQFEQVQLTKEERRELFRKHHRSIQSHRPLRISEIRIARCIEITRDTHVWSASYIELKKRTPKLLQGIESHISQADTAVARAVSCGEDATDEEQQLAMLKQARAFYESDYTIEQLINRMVATKIGTDVALDGFIPRPLWDSGEYLLPEMFILRQMGLRFSPSKLLSLDVGILAFDVGRLLESALESLYPMGPYRRPPERWYIFTGTNPQDVGYQGDLLPSLLYRRPKVVEDANTWLERLQVGYRLDVRPIGHRTRDLFEVRLIDTRRSREVDVALSDVGYGISQVLPFIVQSLASERQIITIEQPEVHVHPRLQADLGDLLAAAIRDPYFHRYIIETHSEHLVLRMQRLVRAGTLQPDDLAVLYVSRGPRAYALKPLGFPVAL